MSKSFLTLSETASKIGATSTTSTAFTRKSDLMGTYLSYADQSKLTSYDAKDFVIDDDIVKVTTSAADFVYSSNPTRTFGTNGIYLVITFSKYPTVGKWEHTKSNTITTIITNTGSDSGRANTGGTYVHRVPSTNMFVFNRYVPLTVGITYTLRIDSVRDDDGNQYTWSGQTSFTGICTNETITVV